VTCNAEAPSVEEVAKQFTGKVAVVGVAWAGSDPEFQDFVDRHGLTFPTLADPDGAVFALFGVPAQPAWVFIGPDGRSTTQLGAEEPPELTGHLNAISA
jgi:peroxiredoxin